MGTRAVPFPGLGTRCFLFSAQMWSPTERVYSRPPDYSGIPGRGIHKAWASDSVTVKQLKPCLPQSSLRENDGKVMPCPQRSLRHFYPADLQRALAVRWAPNPHSYGWEEIRRAPSGRGTDSHRWI